MKEITYVYAQNLLEAAAAWRLASLLLERPRGQWYSEIEQLSSEVRDEELSRLVREAKPATEELYHRCFGPGGTVSPREVSYCGFEDPGRLMAELNSFYHAFAYLPRREEPIDHVAVEAGFVGYLFLKQAYAQQLGDAEAAEITKQARERFMNEHLLRCARGISERLNENPAYLRNIVWWLIKNIHLIPTLATNS
ncbi:MAG TPA: molecular chaperone TorD family protein [Candidatus Binatia bacterium]|nr:molecular chaperone TorD family protein [Candidatus Binatia bacterium]